MTDTQTLEVAPVVDPDATQPMRPPRRRLRVTPLRLVVVSGAVLIAAAFIWSATNPGAVPVPSSPPVPSVSPAPHGGALSFPTDGATLPAERSHAAVVVDAAPTSPQPSVTRPAAVVAAPKPSPSPSGSASPSPSPSGSSSSAAPPPPPAPTPSTSDQESSPS